MMHNFRWSSFLLAASISHIALGMGQVDPQVADLEMQEKVFLPIDAEIGDVQIKIREFKERLVQMSLEQRELTLKGLRAFLNRKDAADYNIYYTLLVGSLQGVLTNPGEKELLQDVSASTDALEGAKRGYPDLGTAEDFVGDAVFDEVTATDPNGVPVPPRGVRSSQLPVQQVVQPQPRPFSPMPLVVSSDDDSDGSNSFDDSGVGGNGDVDSSTDSDDGASAGVISSRSRVVQQPLIQDTVGEDEGDAATENNSSEDATISESGDLVSLFAMPNQNPAMLKEQLRVKLQNPNNHIDFIVLSLDSDYQPYRMKIDKAGVKLVYINGRAYADFGDKKMPLKFDSNKLKGRFKEEQTYEEMLLRKKLMDQVLGLQVSGLDGTKVLSQSPAKKVKTPAAKPTASAKPAPASTTVGEGDDDGLPVSGDGPSNNSATDPDTDLIGE